MGTGNRKLYYFYPLRIGGSTTPLSIAFCLAVINSEWEILSFCIRYYHENWVPSSFCRKPKLLVLRSHPSVDLQAGAFRSSLGLIQVGTCSGMYVILLPQRDRSEEAVGGGSLSARGSCYGLRMVFMSSRHVVVAACIALRTQLSLSSGMQVISVRCTAYLP